MSIAAVVLLAAAVAHLLDAPLRARLEARINANLEGYTVRLGAVDFHPLTFSLELIDAELTQDAHPDPPVAHLPRFTASVHWRALLSGRLVGDVIIDRPTLHLDFGYRAHGRP